MSKPELVRIPSDDCVVTIKDKDYHPHEGEWVELIPGLSIGELHAMRILTDVGPQMEAAKGDEDEGRQVLVIADDAFADATNALAARLLAWNWTDAMGAPFEQPHGNPKVIQALDAFEIRYLLTILHGETIEDRGNGSKPSRTTSSATRSRRSRGS